MPVERHADAIAHDPIHRTDLHRPIKVGAPGLDIPRNLGGIAGDIHDCPIDGHDRLAAACLGDLGVFA